MANRDRDAGKWKELFDTGSITEDDVEVLFQELEAKGNVRNSRTYIGPGSDGSSDDKIAVDMKFHPQTTKITFRYGWNYWCNTVWTQYETGEWDIAQASVPLKDNIH